MKLFLFFLVRRRSTFFAIVFVTLLYSSIAMAFAISIYHLQWMLKTSFTAIKVRGTQRTSILKGINFVKNV